MHLHKYLLALLLICALSCTKSDTCDFDHIKQFDWIGEEISSREGYIHSMSFEAGVWTWTTTELDQSEELQINYIEVALLDKHLFIVDRWGCYFLTGTNVRFDCDSLYLIDQKGNNHILTIKN